MSFQSRARFTAEPDLFTTPASVVQVPRPTLRARMALALATWRERTAARRLRDAGISPAAAAFESGQPFWRSLGDLR